MKIYTCSEARQKLSTLLEIARREEVIIRNRAGETFSLVYRKPEGSPLDVPGVTAAASTEEILDAVRESRSGHR
ncbi:prevent-host-death protein [Chlorobium sp. N1]|nr:prevent-host-death protein [Chlorobium sp. N1]